MVNEVMVPAMVTVIDIEIEKRFGGSFVARMRLSLFLFMSC